MTWSYPTKTEEQLKNMRRAEEVFKEYKDLNELTRKTADETIGFYRNKDSFSESDLFDTWRKLSRQSILFDHMDWEKSWHNASKNLHAFEKHKFQAKFLIQNYLTEVLEELVKRLIHTYGGFIKILEIKTRPENESKKDSLLGLVREEVRKQVKQELAGLEGRGRELKPARRTKKRGKTSC